MPDSTSARLVFLDSCSIINFYASMHFETLVESIVGRPMIADYVIRESQFIRTRTDDGGEEKELIVLDSFVRDGLVEVATLETEAEFELFLTLALRLDDGEAATLTMAASRGGTIVTDDRKALAIAAELSVPVLTTPDVVFRWVESMDLPKNMVAGALRAMRLRARYEPGKHHPLRSWWYASIDSGQLS